MFGLIGYLKDRWLAKTFVKNTLVATPLHNLRKDLSGENSKYVFLPKMSESYKESVIKEFFKLTANVISSPNPIIKNRENLVILVLYTTSLEVLDRFDISDIPYYRNHPAISYELHKYLDKIVEVNKEIKELNFEVGNDLDLLKQEIRINLEVSSCLLSAVNITRVQLEDYHRKDELDWLLPFYKAMLIKAEDDYRQEIGLESLADKYFGSIAGLRLFVYIKFVINGEKYPNFMFEETMKMNIKNQGNEETHKL